MRSAAPLSAMARSNLAWLDLGTKGVFHSLFVTVLQITLQIIQISWLTQQGEADVLRATLVFHQGVIENHVLDASAMGLSVWFILFQSL